MLSKTVLAQQKCPGILIDILIYYIIILRLNFLSASSPKWLEEAVESWALPLIDSICISLGSHYLH